MLKPVLCWRGRETVVSCGLSWLLVKHRGDEIQPLRINTPDELRTLAAELVACCRAFLRQDDYTGQRFPVGPDHVQVSYRARSRGMPVYLRSERGGSETKRGIACVHELELDIAFDLQRWLTRALGLEEVTHPGNDCRFGLVRWHDGTVGTELASYNDGIVTLSDKLPHRLLEQLQLAVGCPEGRPYGVMTRLIPAGPAAYLLVLPGESGEQHIACSRSTLALLACAIEEARPHDPPA